MLVEKETELQHFKNIPEDNDLKEYIKEVDEYILQEQSNGKKVYILDAEEKLSNIFGTKVSISSGKKKGKIEIVYNNEEELNDILSMMMEE